MSPNKEIAIPCIEFDKVSLKLSSGIDIFRSLSFNIEEGEKVSLIGPSGQGKSLLLKLLAGLMSADSGSIRIAPQISNNIGMVFQQNALFDSMTVEDNIKFFLTEESRALSEAVDIQNRVNTLLEATELAHARALFPSELSGGMKKRVSIARALALDPELLLFDDPTAGLDPILSTSILDLILSKAKSNKTALIATSDMKIAFNFSHRFFYIDGGELLDVNAKALPAQVKNFVLGRLK